MKKNRFWLFAGDTYYPSRGLGDYVGSYPTHERALEKVAGINCDWCAIVIENEWGELIETYRENRK